MVVVGVDVPPVVVCAGVVCAGVPVPVPVVVEVVVCVGVPVSATSRLHLLHVPPVPPFFFR